MSEYDEPISLLAEEKLAWQSRALKAEAALRAIAKCDLDLVSFAGPSCFFATLEAAVSIARSALSKEKGE